MNIPSQFNEHGLLNPGDYLATINELRNSLLVTGGNVPPIHWDRQWRAVCVDNLEIMVNQLWKVGIQNIFVDGSFVECKNHPNDIDGYFDCDFTRVASGNLEDELNAIDPKKSWTWDPKKRLRYRKYKKAQLPMWHAYRVELWPNFGQPFGIEDANGNSLNFAQAFRVSRDGDRPKGIIKIVR